MEGFFFPLLQRWNQFPKLLDNWGVGRQFCGYVEDFMLRTGGQVDIVGCGEERCRHPIISGILKCCKSRFWARPDINKASTSQSSSPSYLACVISWIQVTEFKTGVTLLFPCIEYCQDFKGPSMDVPNLTAKSPLGLDPHRWVHTPIDGMLHWHQAWCLFWTRSAKLDPFLTKICA